MMEKKKVAVIMGSDSDFPVVKGAVKKLKSFGIPVEVHVISAHRTPQAAAEFSASAAENGFGVIIAAAGMAAHLAGVLAASTTLPVIGIPMKSNALDGLDALLATVQMPSGIPVATVAIDGADNAAVLAAQILALSDPSLAAKLVEMKQELKDKVAKKDAAIRAEAENL
jgi:5-(carboxyamino)imidazole ribonucleotide mutase